MLALLYLAVYLEQLQIQDFVGGGGIKIVGIQSRVVCRGIHLWPGFSLLKGPGRFRVSNT